MADETKDEAKRVERVDGPKAPAKAEPKDEPTKAEKEEAKVEKAEAKAEKAERTDAKEKFRQALVEGTPADYPWGDLTPEERAEVVDKFDDVIASRDHEKAGV